METQTVSSKELALLLRLTPRRIEQLVDEGIVVRLDRGRYDLKASVGRYCDQLRAIAETATSTATTELTQERLKTIRMRNAERERVLITLEEALSAVEEMAGAFISKLGGMPARITKVPAERRRLEDITDDVRREMAESFAETRTKLEIGDQK